MIILLNLAQNGYSMDQNNMYGIRKFSIMPDGEGVQKDNFLRGRGGVSDPLPLINQKYTVWYQSKIHWHFIK